MESKRSLKKLKDVSKYMLKCGAMDISDLIDTQINIIGKDLDMYSFCITCISKWYALLQVNENTISRKQLLENNNIILAEMKCLREQIDKATKV